jgi:hypothetical protein
MPGCWIRWSCVMLACAALCLVQPATAGEAPSAFDSANQAYIDGKPAEAARTLERVIVRHGYSAPVLFNLANSLLCEGKAGQAVLNYERAQWLAPRDPDIAANLRLARERTQAATAADRSLPVADWLTVNGWASLGAGALLLFAATLPLGLRLRRQRAALRLAGILALTMVFCSLAAIAVRWRELNHAVITAKSADARISPVTVGAPMVTLPEGAVVSILKSHGHFALVSARNGQQGWVNRDTLEPVISAAD